MTHESPAPEDRDPADAAAPEEAPAASRPGSEERKERVLHTRVPAVLERELKRFAANLRVPVSNLVRAILEDAVNAADRATVNVENQLLSAVKQLEVERERINIASDVAAG